MSTSEQARRDAMADAETLQGYLGTYGLLHIETARAAVEAEVSGRRAARYLMQGYFDGAEIYAYEAARLAARAVPGLRD